MALQTAGSVPHPPAVRVLAVGDLKARCFMPTSEKENAHEDDHHD
jgi:hypothetical protein